MGLGYQSTEKHDKWSQCPWCGLVREESTQRSTLLKHLKHEPLQPIHEFYILQTGFRPNALPAATSPAATWSSPAPSCADNARDPAGHGAVLVVVQWVQHGSNGSNGLDLFCVCVCSHRRGSRGAGPLVTPRPRRKREGGVGWFRRGPRARCSKYLPTVRCLGVGARVADVEAPNRSH